MIRALLAFVTLAFFAGCGASSPTSPAQIPTSVEYATFELNVATTTSADLALSRLIAGKAPDLSGSVTCSGDIPLPSLNSAYCFNPSEETMGLMQVQICKCQNSAGTEVACEVSGYDTVSPDGNPVECVDVWDAATTTTSTVASLIYSAQVGSTAVSIPGTEQVTTEGSYSVMRTKLAFIRQILPADTSLGELSGATVMICTMDGGCVEGSDFNTQSTLSVISASQRGDMMVDAGGGDFQWYDQNAKAFTDTRPSLPLTNTVIANNSGDILNLDSNDGALLIDIFDDDSSIFGTVVLGGTYTLTWTASIYSTFDFIDIDPSGVFTLADDSFDIWYPLRNVVTLQ